MSKKITNSESSHQTLRSNLPDVIKLSAFGMDDSSLQRLSTMFTIIFKGSVALVPPDKAMIALIDIDDHIDEDKASGNIIKSYQKDYPDLPFIVLAKSLPDKTHGNIRYIEKPLKREEFWTAIIELFGHEDQIKPLPSSQLDKATKAQTSKSAAELDSKLNQESRGPKIAPLAKNDSKQSIYFKPKKHLLCYLQKLLSKQHPENCALRIEFAYKYRIILCPDIKMALTNLSDNEFRNVAIMKISANQTCRLIVENNTNLEQQRSASKGEFSVMTIDALLWTLALRTSRGRLPVDTSVNKKMYLHAWPNLPRLCKTPHAMRIASLWIKKPSGLNELATLLGINFRDVYSFYTAAHALGLADHTERKSDNTIKSKPVLKNKKRGLFGAILRGLKRKE